MSKSPTAKVQTGIAGLDEILLGGVTRNNNILVEGAPGAGKTTLGLRFIQSGASLYNEPGIIISFELDPDKLIRDAIGFNWPIDKLMEQNKLKVVHASPAVLLKEFRAHDSVLMHHIKDVGAKRLMIDGLTPLKLYAEANQLPFREDLHALVEDLTSRGVTTLMTAERDIGSADLAHERYVFDTIVSLSCDQARHRIDRRLTVQKSRGQHFLGGSHSMNIVSGIGVEVYPRANARVAELDSVPASDKRISTGAKALDAIMDGGLYEGSITLVTGIAGTGKTVAAMQYLCAAAKSGKRCLLVSLDEHPAQIIRNAKTLGLDLQKPLDDGTLILHYESPLDLDLDRHFNRVIDLMTTHNIECAVFDSVAAYEVGSPEDAPDFLFALGTFCKQRLATVYFNYESPELLGISQISQGLKASQLADNIILLSYVEISTQLRRALAVPKVRGSHNRQVTCEYSISQGGITILEDASHGTETAPVPQLPFSSYYGLLARSPSRRSPAIDEAITQGEPIPTDVQLTPKK